MAAPPSIPSLAADPSREPPTRPSGGGRAPRLAGALIALGLIASAFLPRDASWLVALTVVIVLGVPHGALDGAVAAPLLRPRYGRMWFGIFAVPYLGLSALVLLVWQIAPLATLAGFLSCRSCISARRMPVPAALSRPSCAAVFRSPCRRCCVPMRRRRSSRSSRGCRCRRFPPGGRPWPGCGWPAAAWPPAAARGPYGPRSLLAAAFWGLPPLTAFTLYFVGLHGPRHMRALVRDPMGARHRHDGSGRHRLAAGLRVDPPVRRESVAALRLGPRRRTLLTLTLQILSALTVPHVLLDRLAARQHGHP